jgi:hypothetical protein
LMNRLASAMQIQDDLPWQTIEPGSQTAWR